MHYIYQFQSSGALTYAAATVVFAGLFLSNAKWKWWKSIDNELMFKLIEIFKLVSLFVLLLNTSSVVSYSCAIPPDFVQLGILSHTEIPLQIEYCYRPELWRQFNLSEEHQKVVDGLCEISNSDSTYYVWSLLIGIEAFNLIYFFINRSFILQQHKIAILLFVVSAIGWLSYEFIRVATYYIDYECRIYFVEILSRFSVVTNLFMAALVVIYISSMQKWATKVNPQTEF